jgi:cytochrome c-type biogenesis protein CcsB|uniref:Cytochrome c biogenesis protein CcsA n=1 Tax=Prasiola crispa TaxID=173492 RepID=A0A0R8RXU9_PRACR|nr:heme attachment to plastid cytochrome c [Prasiola crispa]
MTYTSLLYTIADTFDAVGFEVFLGNFSFVILFSLMLLYWVEAVFSIIPNFNLIIFYTTLCANLTLFILLLVRWITYNHFPLSNLYESLIFLSWSFTLIQLILIPFILNLTKIPQKTSINESSSFFLQTSFTKNEKKVTNINTLIGTIISPIALFINSFATFSLPKTMQKAQALVPALQSNWLMMHVTIMMLSYTALLCGSLLAITFLIVTWYQSKKNLKSKTSVDPCLNGISDQEPLTSFNVVRLANNTIETNYQYPLTPTKSKIDSTTLPLLPSITEKTDTGFSGFIQNVKPRYIDPKNSSQEIPLTELTRTLDNLSYRILGIGFPLLTIGILSGAVWANEAWGSYWSWDPKETWAFITWLIFAIYLHTRITKGWEGRKPALLATFGFFIVWICYLGVNILGTGLHSYGFLT